MYLRTAHEVGLLVKDQRRKLGWTQADLAGRLGVGRLWVVQLEQGKDTAQIGLVLRALNELRIPMQVDLSTDPYSQPRSSDFIDLDMIIQEAAKPYGS